MQVTNPQTTDLWLNRFNSWYSAIDRVSQKAKTKFVKMKSDIMKAISKKLKNKDMQKNNEQEGQR